MMDPLESFGGSAGQVVRGFVRPGTLLTTIPVIIVTMILAAISAAVVDLMGLPAPAALFVMLVAASPVVGRFALPARDGELDAGFVEAHFDGGELTAFVLRYAALTLAWFVPTALLIGWLAPSLGGVATAGVAAVLVGPSALVLVLLLLVMLLAPTLSLLVATRTEAVSDALSVAAWRWLAVDRRRDLVVFYASLVGGLVLFVLIAAPLLLILAALAFALAPTAGGMIALFAWIAPGAASPVLLGRLAGAFVLAEQSSGGAEQARMRGVLGDGDLPAATISALSQTMKPGGDGISPAKARRSADGILDLSRPKARGNT